MDNIKVLIADDHALVRAGIRNGLKELSYLNFVAEVDDGPSLLAALAKYTPDCLLIDVTMPNFDPLVTIARIRRQYPAMKILVVSAYDDDVYVQGLLTTGVDGYHMKDQPLSDLRLAVERVLAGERWVSSRLLDKLLRTSAPSAIVLTPRQRDILQMLHTGLDNQSIARKMGLSVKTIENHLTRLYRQLNVQSRLEAVTYATQHPDILGTLLPRPAVSSPAPMVLTADQIGIMVVDDNHRYRSQLHRTIAKICPRAVISEAATIAEAEAIAHQNSAHLAFVDVVLGDEDGIHCTRRLKAATPDLRVILISAYPDREFHRLGLKAGAVAFLDKKDLDTAALQHVINDLV